MTLGNIGHQPHPFHWVNEGWEHLKESARSAITHFSPSDDSNDEAQAQSSGGWGLMAADVVASEKEFVARFELPGMEKDEIEVAIEDGRIVVAGEKRVDDQFNYGDVIVTERTFGRFRRSVLVPGAINTTEASAEYKNGVLTVKVPRADSAASSDRIRVK